jgi:hypothetical protein
LEITRHKLIGSLAGLVLLIAAVSIWNQLRSHLPPVNRVPFAAAGQMLAVETANAIHNQGQIVAVVNPQYQVSGTAWHDKWQAFQKELQKHPNVHLTATEVHVSDPQEDFEPEPGCSGAAFRRLLERHGQMDAIVFFVSLPRWRAMEKHQQVPAPVAARIVALEDHAYPVRQQYGDYFANGLLSVLVYARAFPVTPGTPKTPREWVEQHYFDVYTPQNYNSTAAK